MIENPAKRAGALSGQSPAARLGRYIDRRLYRKPLPLQSRRKFIHGKRCACPVLPVPWPLRASEPRTGVPTRLNRQNGSYGFAHAFASTVTRGE